MKMSASEYYKLPTVRKFLRLVRSQARRHRIGWSGPDKKVKDSVRVSIKLKDATDGNILKTRRYKGRIRKG